MEALPKNPLLEYNPDTLQYIRKQYDYDQQRMKEALDIIEEWLRKQTHFVKKTLPREYLERVLVHNKGSIETSKRKLDKLFTLRTLLPDFFKNVNIANEMRQDTICSNYLLPKMTPDYCRVHILKIRKHKYTTENINRHLNCYLHVSDYLQTYDYCNGLIYLGDWRDGSPFEYGLAVNISDFRKALEIGMEGYSMRIVAIHLLSESTAVEAFVTLLRQVVSPKIGSRIQVHKSMETVYQYIPKDVLPAEYGGNEKPLDELQEKLHNAFDTEEFKRLRQDINEARTDESLRSKDVFNEYMGMPGTFRNLNVD